MSTKRPKLAQVGRQMGQHEHQKAQVGSSWPPNGARWAPGGRKRGPSWSQDGPRWGWKEARWAPIRARRAQERPKLAPRAARKKGTQNLTTFGTLLGSVLEVFSCSRRSSEAFGRGSFFGHVFGALLGMAGRVKAAILYGTSAKNTASDLKDKRQKTVPKSTPKIIKKRLGRRLLGCRNQDPKKVRKMSQK